MRKVYCKDCIRFCSNSCYQCCISNRDIYEYYKETKNEEIYKHYKGKIYLINKLIKTIGRSPYRYMEQLNYLDCTFWNKNNSCILYKPKISKTLIDAIKKIAKLFINN